MRHAIASKLRVFRRDDIKSTTLNQPVQFELALAFDAAPVPAPEVEAAPEAEAEAEPEGAEAE